ncbi:MAG TPA: DUF5666 domain-containing protein [Variovorax sp.]|nr:DUF5666 domain-containing protein [Variovorax sp.]
MSTRLLRASLASLMLTLLLSCGGGGADSASGGASQNGTSVQGESASGSNSPGDGSSTGDSGSNDGSTSTASGGDDAGVGSGGTGVSTADAGTSVGAVDGMGSIIVGGLRYDVDQAEVDLRDDTELKIGMSIAVTGPMDADFVSGTARRLSSATELRGPVSSIDPAAGTFEMMGGTVSVDEGTVWGDLRGIADLMVNTTVQVWGLPTAAGALRATRIETRSPGTTPIATGMVAQLDPVSATFMLGGLRVSYASASFGPGLTAAGLADGLTVRVRADQQTVPGQLEAARIERWYWIPKQAGIAVQVEGVISDFASQGAFRVLGTAVDASAAQVAGGQAAKLGDGVKVVASGTLSADGTLLASKIKIRHIPGGGALPSYSLIGKVTNYQLPADFRVRGQKVDASAPDVVFENGTAAQLANGVDVTVQGTRIVNDVLIATQVRFD